MHLTNQYGDIFYRVEGPEKAPAVLFCHGINMNHETFGAQVEALRSEYRVIVWDLPFHGESSAIDPSLAFSDVCVVFIEDLMRNLELSSIALVGLSLGSYVVQRAAFQLGDRVRGTVHIGGTSLYPSVPSFLNVFNPLVGAVITLYPRSRVFRDFARHRTLKPETQAYVERIATQNGKGVMKHLTQELVRDMTRGLPARTQEPKLLCHGDHEISFVKRQMKRWSEQCPNSQYHVISNAHHVANQDNPEEMNEVLLSFLHEVWNTESVG